MEFATLPPNPEVIQFQYFKKLSHGFVSEHKGSAMEDPMWTGHVKMSTNHTNIKTGKDLQDRHERALAHLKRNFYLSWRIPLHQWIMIHMSNEEKNQTAKQWGDKAPEAKKLIFKRKLTFWNICHLCKRWELPPAMQQQQPRTVAPR